MLIFNQKDISERESNARFTRQAILSFLYQILVV
jgi:hypothetical protein